MSGVSLVIGIAGPALLGIYGEFLEQTSKGIAATAKTASKTPVSKFSNSLDNLPSTADNIVGSGNAAKNLAPVRGAGVADALETMGTRLQRLGYDETNATRILNAIQNGEQVVVIGENMKRVGAVARMVENAGGRSVTYAPKNFRSTPGNLSRLDIEANRSWIRYWAKEKGSPIIDIGRQPTIRPDGPSPFYGVENRSLNRWNIYTPFSE